MVSSYLIKLDMEKVNLVAAGNLTFGKIVFEMNSNNW